MRAMHQQFTTALDGLTQNTELKNELAQSRQQAAKELAALRQEGRGAPLRGTQATGVGVDTRLLGKQSDFSEAHRKLGGTGAQCSRCTLAQRYHVCRN